MAKAQARPQKIERIDLHQSITDQILSSLREGVRPWAPRWTRSAGPISRPLRHSGEAYRGINILLLWARAVDRGFSSPHWMTFRQARDLGGHVRKGEQGTMVVYANAIAKTETDAAGEEVERRIAFLKSYTVFNRDQIDDLPEHFHEAVPTLDESARIAAAERFFAATGIRVAHGGDDACYVPSTDHIEMPFFAAFRDASAYYATLGHEAVHATGHPSRVGRDFSTRYGDDAYAREELVAELGAAFLCADLGISAEPRADHAAYLDHWLTILGGDPRFIVAAAAKAQRACDWLHDRQR
jgi:antirestriction protein ArdC